MKHLKRTEDLYKIRLELATAFNKNIDDFTPSLLNNLAQVVVSTPNYIGEGHSGRMTYARKMANGVTLMVIASTDGWQTMYPISHSGLGSDLKTRSKHELAEKLAERRMVKV